MTQRIFGVLRYLPSTDLQEAAARLHGIAAKAGLGIRIGLPSIPVSGVDDEEELRILSHLLGESQAALAFDLPSSPTDDNIEDVFESEFNPPWEANPENSRIVSFLRQAFGEPHLTSGSIVVYEKPGAALEALPRRQAKLGEFERWLTRYYLTSGMPGGAPADAIHDVTK